MMTAQPRATSASRPATVVETNPPCRRFAGQVVLVTGAARGIGRATAARFAAEGAGVVLADLDAVLLSQQATSLDGHSLPLDVTDAAQVRQAIESALGWRGRLDALVNVAGVLDRTSVAEL